MSDYDIDSEGYLSGDPLLSELRAAGFGVMLFVRENDSNAGLDCLNKEGWVPGRDLLYRFAAKQDAYRKELRIQALLKQRRGKGKLRG